MGRTRSQIDAELAELYARIPDIPDCDGRCWVSCGPTDRSQREDQRIRQAGIRIRPADEALADVERYYCEALTEDKRCAVYEMRPMVCRLWGAVEGMKCPFGCVPEGGWLPDSEGALLVAESLRVGGSAVSNVPSGELAAVMASDFMRKHVANVQASGRAGIERRIQETVPAAFRKPSRPPVRG